MKKCCIIFLSLFIITVTAIGFWGQGQARQGASLQPTSQTQAYFRLHVRADSNADRAQAVKYLVRDELVDYLTPLVAEYETAAEAVAGVEKELGGIEAAAERVLKRQGFSYGAKAEIRRESFPTRTYGEYTLPSGEYTALIVELGSGKGDNWWCVIYPPLCFSAPRGENVIYQSKIAEIIRNFSLR